MANSLSSSSLLFRRHYMTVSENHRIAAEVFGTVCWLWIFHRASNDLPVVLGWRHPWEHAPGDDDHGHGGDHGHHHAPAGPSGSSQMNADWDKFGAKSTNFNEDDDEDDEEE